VHIPGQREKSHAQTDMLAVGPGFLSTLHIRLLAGLVFNPGDFASAAATDAAEKATEEASRKAGASAAPRYNHTDGRYSFDLGYRRGRDFH
jgi:hypothetical protein